mmetsp:Transcript_13521/g.49189  ORF Transcript_13521/g.49189 Transcript_13521/m.49189 type:complete len:298 (-) Transcript_13521:65-958(-)
MFRFLNRRPKATAGEQAEEEPEGTQNVGQDVKPKGSTKQEANMTDTNGTVAKPLPMVVCGPSGVGKGTLINMLIAQHAKSFGFSVSHTTRPPRDGEVDGQHYHFATKEQILKEIDEGKFLEYAHVHGNVYGTSFAAVESVSKAGKCCILDIDVQGAQKVKAKFGKGAYYVFIKPPSMDELERRLRDRGTETEESIKTRLDNCVGEIEMADNEKGFFDRIFVNDDLKATYEKFENVALMAARGETPVKMRKDVAYKNKLAKGSSQPVEEVVGTGKLVKRGGKVFFVDDKGEAREVELK